MLSQETIEAVRSRVSIVQVIGERLRLERKGRDVVGLCPFHKEKTPSFSVNPDKGVYYCRGCHASGNVISFVQQLEGLSFPEAVRELAERAGIEIKETGSVEEQRREAEQRRRRDELYTAGAVAADYFERCLAQHPLRHHARQELQRRGLDSPDPQISSAMSAFRVGYAPAGWSGLADHLRSLGFHLPAAEEVGLIRARRSGAGYYDLFRHRLMFAVLDLRGRVVAFSGRALPPISAAEAEQVGADLDDPAKPPPKYYNSPESPIFKKRDTAFGLFQARQSVRSLDRCLLVEGNFDVLSLHARGITNAIAPLGTAFTPEQAAQIKRYTEHVVVLFDGDSAGQRATAAVRGPCQQAGLRPRAARLPSGKDPDDLIREGGSERLQRIVQGARPLLEYLIDTSLESGFATDDAQARADKIRQVAELIASESDPAVRAMAESHADTIAGRLGILAGVDARSFRAFRSSLTRSYRGSDPEREQAAPPERARSRSRVRAVRDHVLGAALEYPELLEDPELADLTQAVEGELSLALVALRRLVLSDEVDWKQAEPAQVAQGFPVELQHLVTERLTSPQIATLEEARLVFRENLSKLDRLQQRRERAGVAQELAKAAAGGDVDAELELLRLQQERARARHGLG